MRKILISFVSITLAIIAVLTPSIGAFALNETENNDTIQTATAIEVNEIVQGRIDNSKNPYDELDNDYYKFTLQEDGYIRIKFEHDYFDGSESFSFSVWLKDENDTALGGYLASDADDLSITTGGIGLAAGTYYIEVYLLFDTDFDYNFTIEYTPSDFWETYNNDNLKYADKIEVNQTHYGACGKDDDDYFKFEIPTDGFISVTFNHDYKEAVSDFSWIRILSYNGTEENTLLDFDSRYQSEKTNSIECGLSAGTYYVCVSGFYYSCWENYSFIVNYTSSDSWEKETNDNHALADNIDIEKTYCGSIDNDDKDYFKFTTETDGYINLKLLHDYLEGDDVFAKVSMYSYNGTEKNIITSFNSKFSWEGVSSGKEFLEAGTYYFYLDNSETNGEQYSFIVEFFENLPETTTVIETTISEYDYSYDAAETTYSLNAEDVESPNSCVGEIIIVVLLIMAFVIAIILKAKNKKKDN